MAQRRVRVGTIRVQRTVTVRQTRRVTVTAVPQPSATIRPAGLASSTAAPRALPTSRRRLKGAYTQRERELLDRVAEAVDHDVERPRDAFLCHAWSDRDGAAEELFMALTELDVDVWFSERDVKLGVSLARQLDAGLRASRVGLVLVTTSMLESLRSGGFADQELGALLATDRVIPVVHGVPYEQLRRESPLLASRAGLSTETGSLRDVAVKIAESVLSPIIE